MKPHGLASVRVCLIGEPTVQISQFPLVMVPTPVPPIKWGTTLPPVPCPVLPLGLWAGLAPMPPLCPLHQHPHNKFNSEFLSHPVKVHCPLKQKGQTPLRQWQYVPMSQNTRLGPSLQERVQPL